MLKGIIENFNKEMGKIRTLKEALSFENPHNEHQPISPVETQINAHPNNEDHDKAKTLVDNIRKMALNGMSEMADNIENPNYDTLKKVWQLCERKPDIKKAEDKIN